MSFDLSDADLKLHSMLEDKSPMPYSFDIVGKVIYKS